MQPPKKGLCLVLLLSIVHTIGKPRLQVVNAKRDSLIYEFLGIKCFEFLQSKTFRLRLTLKLTAKLTSCNFKMVQIICTFCMIFFLLQYFV